MLACNWSSAQKALHLTHRPHPPWPSVPSTTDHDHDSPMELPDDTLPTGNDALVILLPLLIVLSTLLFLLLLFLICVLVLRRRRGIVLRDNEGPLDLSREEFLGAGDAFETVEARWMESVSEHERSSYQRSQTWQNQYPPNSLATDITLSQFLSIQEKGVSAWSFEPDYESATNLLVHARTELTFLPDPSSSSSVQSNLPLPKLNEVYYWEVKMFDLPPTTNVSIGLATKPFPSFRLPGHNRHSIAYHSSGEKSYNYPFTASSYGPPLKEGDVLGIGFRPRSGTVFFTRNGRKMEDAFVGLSRFNLFPTVGADGPCSVHVNLGQSGFVHIEANVKKWGLAPSVGTLAPPPAYGSERGSILLEAGGTTGTTTPASAALGRRARGTRGPPPSIEASSQAHTTPATSAPTSPPPNGRTHRISRRAKPPGPLLSTAPSTSSPLRGNTMPSTQDPVSPQEGSSGQPHPPARYISPTDAPYHLTTDRGLPPPTPESEDAPSRSTTSSRSSYRVDLNDDGGEEEEERPLISVQNDAGEITGDSSYEDPGSPSQLPNPPTPHVSDIHLQPLNVNNNRYTSHSRHASLENTTRSSRSRRSRNSNGQHRHHHQHHSRSASETPAHLLPPSDMQPPAYSPLDSFVYPNGVAIDLPAEVIAAALEGPTPAQRAAAENQRVSALAVMGSNATDAQRAAARAAFRAASGGR